jgi:hypothetical protein
VNLEKIHLFDPNGGRTLTLHEGRSGGVTAAQAVASRRSSASRVGASTPCSSRTCGPGPGSSWRCSPPRWRYAGDILVAGSAKLAATLRANGVVDEYRLMVHPVVLGEGKRLFDKGGASDPELVESRSVGPNVLLLTYHPAAAAA